MDVCKIFRQNAGVTPGGTASRAALSSGRGTTNAVIKGDGSCRYIQGTCNVVLLWLERRDCSHQTNPNASIWILARSEAASSRPRSPDLYPVGRLTYLSAGRRVCAAYAVRSGAAHTEREPEQRGVPESRA